MTVRASILIVLATLLALPTLAPAGEGDEEKRAYLRIDGGSAAKFPLAFPALKLEEGADPSAAQLIYQVVQRDLELSGYFDIISQMAYIESSTAGLEAGTFDFADWRVCGAAGLVKAGLTTEGDRHAVELHVYDVDGGVQTLGRVLSGQDGNKRGLGHHLANAIIEAFTGEAGIFHTRIVTVVNYGQGKEVYVFDFDGQNRRAVSRNGSINLSPAWSPDGKKITYTSYRDNNPDLWMTDLDSGRHSKVSGRPGINAGAEWSPDGTEIALTLSKDQGNSDIYALDSSGSILRRLTRDYGIDVSPAYSPGGETIAFVSGRLGNPQLFVMERDGSNQRRLTQRGGHNVSPAWSPDGSRIAFAGRDEGRFDIFVVNSDGTGLKRLTQSRGDDEDPTWSPDGNHILFSSSRDGGGKQLYIMTADGNSQTRITDGTGSFSNPQWGPAGE
jgi:TolB protein